MARSEKGGSLKSAWPTALTLALLAAFVALAALRSNVVATSAALFALTAALVLGAAASDEGGAQ